MVALLLLLPFVPSWRAGQWAAALVAGAISIIGGVWLLFRGEAPPVFRRKAILGAAVTLGTITILCVVLLAYWMDTFGHPGERQIRGSDDSVLYLYEYTCFPPDSRSECGEYSSEIRVRVWVFPVTRTLYSCKCFFGEPSIKSGVAEIPLEENRSSAESFLRIDLRSGEILRDG